MCREGKYLWGQRDTLDQNTSLLRVTEVYWILMNPHDGLQRRRRKKKRRKSWRTRRRKRYLPLCHTMNRNNFVQPWFSSSQLKTCSCFFFFNPRLVFFTWGREKQHVRSERVDVFVQQQKDSLTLRPTHTVCLLCVCCVWRMCEVNADRVMSVCVCVCVLWYERIWQVSAERGESTLAGLLN